MKNIDKYKGCLIGGAIGDALGYSVEFMDEDAIFSKYGKEGITEYELVDNVAQISDDTQMTLFTANGLLIGNTRINNRGIGSEFEYYVYDAYKEWYITQTNNFPYKPNEYHKCWLLNIPELFNRRSPGYTCLSELSYSSMGTIDNPLNQSKGCGGIMRIAPVGLFFESDKEPSIDLDEIGAKCAAITHGHELGYIPAATLTHIIRRLAHENITIEEAINSAIKAIKILFKEADNLDYFINLIEKAIVLSKENINDLVAIHMLGEGWVAEETLAIAIYCALKYSNSFEKAIIASVNHKGDSDSTGSVTGNIIGTYLGYSNIPYKYLNNLELKDIIIEIAEDLFHKCQMQEYSDYYDDVWHRKYIKTCYPNLEVSYMDTSNLISRILKEFPDKKAIIDEHKNDYGEYLLHVLCPDIINYPLIDLFKENKDIDTIRKYCNLIEDMWKYGDEDILNVVNVTILEHLSDDNDNWQLLGKYISQEFKDYINNDLLNNNVMMFLVPEIE